MIKGKCINLLGLPQKVELCGFKTEWLKQQSFIFSQFWSLRVQNSGVSNFGFLRGLSLACRWLPSHGVFKRLSLRVCLGPDSVS